MRYVYWVSLIITIVGAINWGLIGTSDYNLISHIIKNPNLEKVIYSVVGLAGVYLAGYLIFNYYFKESDASINW